MPTNPAPGVRKRYAALAVSLALAAAPAFFAPAASGLAQSLQPTPPFAD